MADRELRIHVTVDPGGRGRAAVSELSSGVQRVGSTAATAGAAFSRMAGAIGGALVLGRLNSFAQDSIGLMAAQESAITALNTAMASQGTASEGLSAQYQTMASGLQAVTTFGDEAFIAMQALLIQVGDVGPEKMEAALRASADLAAGLGVDLRTATLLVGKAFAGETGTLTRYGIVIDDAKLKTEGAAAVLDGITAKFGGQATAAAETYAGQVEQLGNAWGDLKEEIGKVLIPLIQQVLPAIQRGITLFQGLSPEVKTAVTIFGGLTAAFVALSPVLFALGTALAAIATGPIALVVAAVVGLTAAWVAWGGDVTRIVSQTITGVRDWLVGRFGAIVDTVREKVAAVTGFFSDMYTAVVGESIVPDMVNEVGAHMNRLQETMVAPAKSALDGVMGEFTAWGDSLGGLMGGLFGSGGILSGIMTGGLSTIMSSLQDVAMKGLGWIGGKFKGLFGGPSAKELAGREIVEEFQGNIASMLDETQAIEAGGEQWKAVNIGVRDAYKEVGLSEREALDDVQRLYDAIKEGPSAVNPLIDEIRAKMDGLRSSIASAGAEMRALTSGANSAPASVPSPASVVPMAAGGAGTVRKPTLFLAGERGPEQFAFSGANRGFRGGNVSVNVSIDGGIFDTPGAIDRLAARINRETVRQMQRQRQL